MVAYKIFYKNGHAQNFDISSRFWENDIRTEVKSSFWGLPFILNIRLTTFFYIYKIVGYKTFYKNDHVQNFDIRSNFQENDVWNKIKSSFWILAFTLKSDIWRLFSTWVNLWKIKFSTKKILIPRLVEKITFEAEARVAACLLVALSYIFAIF